MATTTTPTAPGLNVNVRTDDDASEVSEASAQLAEAEAQLVREFGFKASDGDLFFVKGTKLWDVGIAASKKHAAEYAKLPTIEQAASQLSTTIAAEQRRDRVIEPAKWTVDREGLLRLDPEAGPNGEQVNGIAVQVNSTAWTQLGSLQSTLVEPLPPPWDPNYETAKAARDALPKELIKAWEAPRGNVNAWIDHVKGERKMRVRNAPDGTGRQAFAMVSKKYAPYDGDACLRDLAKALPGVKCELRYNPENTETRVRALIQAPIDIPAFVGVGRVHQAGIEFRTRDDGMGSLSGRGFLVRVRCKNHSLATEQATKIKRRHVGTQADLVAELQGLLGTIPTMIEKLRELWSNAAAHHYLDTDGTPLSVQEALTRLIVNEHIPTGGLKLDDAVENYMSAWRAEESPTSAAGIMMAVQRAAHEGSWRTKWATDEIEEAASKALYQPVYVLAAPEDTRAPIEMD